VKISEFMEEWQFSMVGNLQAKGQFTKEWNESMEDG
jgi:hypothetical protein